MESVDLTPPPPAPARERSPWLTATWQPCAMQGAFWFLTGIWPLLHMPSFLAISGPKHDLWLVRAMGMLISVVGATLLLAAIRRRISAEIVLLAIGGALTLTAIDVYYSFRGVIWKTYLLDAIAELILVALWVLTLTRQRLRRRAPATGTVALHEHTSPSETGGQP